MGPLDDSPKADVILKIKLYCLTKYVSEAFPLRH
jgi:hypothetical protein